MRQARTKLVVLTKFQKWFVINFLLYTAAFLAIFAVGLLAWFKLLAQGLLNNFGGLLSPTFVELTEKHMTYGVFAVGVLVATLLGLAAWQSLIFSRRIAGPLFAFARHLENCERDGKLTHLQLRQGDLFSEMAEKFNGLADRINGEKGSA